MANKNTQEELEDMIFFASTWIPDHDTIPGFDDMLALWLQPSGNLLANYKVGFANNL